jgi:hypothetical protein
MPCHAMHPLQDLFLESFSYELQLDMHSYLHKNFILAKSGCYKDTITTSNRPGVIARLEHHIDVLQIFFIF